MASGISYTGTAVRANPVRITNDVINEHQQREAAKSFYGDFDPSAIADAIFNKLNYLDPDSYLQSAWDIANLNTMTSQALAREQMAYQTQANAKAMDFNALEAQKTRDWEQMMSSTAHQREVEDLLKAGLNPILSANQGAATPAAANAQGVTSSGAKGSVDTSIISAMMNVYTQAMNLKLQDKQIDAQLAMNLLNNETTRYAADKGAYGAVTAAGLNSSAARYSADIQKMIYEEGYHGLGSVLGNIATEGITTVQELLGSNSPADAVVNMIENAFPWTKKFFESSDPGPGRTERAPIRGSGGSDGRSGGIRYSY